MSKWISLIVPMVLAFPVVAAEHSDKICENAGTLIFNCKLPRSTASLCMSRTGSLTYTAQSFKGNALKLTNLGDKGTKFRFSNVAFSGGGEAHIRFQNNGYEYFLFDKTVKTNEGPDFNAGILVYRSNRRIASFTCENDASIHEDAYTQLPREQFRSIQLK
jgi:hypothetical protein